LKFDKALPADFLDLRERFEIREKKKYERKESKGKPFARQGRKKKTG